MKYLEIFVHTTMFTIFTTILITAHYKFNKLSSSTDPEVTFIHDMGPRFYTNWGMVVQFIYSMCMVISHLMSLVPYLSKYSSKLHRFSDDIFTIIGLPTALVISTVFWVMYQIDKESLIPAWLHNYIPWYINHSLHTFNSVLPIIDLLLCKHEFSSWYKVSKWMLIFSTAYLIVMIDTKLRYGKYMYRILNTFTDVQLGFFVIMCTILGFMFHGAARYIRKLRWGPLEAVDKII